MIGFDDDDPDDPWEAQSPVGGVVVQAAGPSDGTAIGTFRLPLPQVQLTGPRRVGIQVGHWKTDEAPAEMPRLVEQTGGQWDEVREVDINLDIAQRIVALLDGQGIIAELLPVNVTPGYLADAVVALHADDDGVGERSGFKLAYSARRTPAEKALLESIAKSYAAGTGMESDEANITPAMRGYYLFNWTRYQHAISPYTPGVILEMGYVSSASDRDLMLGEPDRLAGAIAKGISDFLAATPRQTLFGQELVVPAFPPR
jgi:N-acetylmuramoyl-L-alanine amidase